MGVGSREWGIGNGVGREVRVSFSMGKGLPYFQRFRFFIDDRGVQDVRGPGRKRYVHIGLRDLSAKLRKTDENRDWTAPAVFTYSVVCDKTQPHRSLVHGIAQRAGLGVNDIDCATIPVTLPYVRLRRDIWGELSSLATAYRCHLECPVEKPLVFAHSPYQAEPLLDDEVSYTFTGEDIFYLRKVDRAELYRNTVRLKINMPVSLEKQEIWRYDENLFFMMNSYKPTTLSNIRLFVKLKRGNMKLNTKLKTLTVMTGMLFTLMKLIRKNKRKTVLIMTAVLFRIRFMMSPVTMTGHF
jgi:hypothetical protein